MPNVRLLVAAAALLGLSGVAPAGQSHAQVAPDRDTSNLPIMVGADVGEMSDTGFTLRGRAEILQGDNRLRADAIEGRRVGGSVTQVTASGDVYYVTPDQTIRGDRAVYDVSTATIVVTGDVILTEGKNVLTGGRLSYNVDTGEARIGGAPAGQAGSRVQGVFYPERSGT